MLAKAIKKYRESFIGLSRQTWLLSIVMLVNRAGTMAIPFLGIYATQALGRSLKDAGFIITLFGVGSIAGASLGGWLTDKIGFRPVQVATAILSGLLFMVVPFIGSFNILCFHIVLLAIVAEALRPANYSAIASYALPGTLTRSYSLNRLAINLGWAFGGALGGLLASINYSLLFFVDGGTNILAGIMIWILLSERITKVPKPRVTKPPAGMVVLSPWRDKWFIQFLFYIMVFNTCFFLLFRLVPIFWKEVWRLDERTIGLLLGFNGVIIALVEMVLVNRWESRNRPFRYIVAGAIATALAYGLLLIPGTQMFWIIISIACVIMLTIGEMLAMPFMNSTSMQRANEYNRGKYAAGYTLSWSVAQVAGPAGGAWIADSFGYAALWVVLMIVLMLTAFGITRIAKTYKTIAA